MYRKCFLVKFSISNANIEEILDNLYEKYDFEFEKGIDIFGNIQYEYSGMYCDRFKITETSEENIFISLLFYEGRNKDKLGTKKFLMKMLNSTIPNLVLLYDKEIKMDETFNPDELYVFE